MVPFSYDIVCRLSPHCISFYTVSQKYVPLLFYANFGKRGPIFIMFFTVKFRNDLRMKSDLFTTTTSPQICCYI